MEIEYIKSGLLFNRKCLGAMLVSMCFNNPEICYGTTKADILYNIIEGIDGNIWRAYLCKHGIEAGIEEILIYIKANQPAVTIQINDTGYPELAKHAAWDMLQKLVK